MTNKIKDRQLKEDRIFKMQVADNTDSAVLVPPINKESIL